MYWISFMTKIHVDLMYWNVHILKAIINIIALNWYKKNKVWSKASECNKRKIKYRERHRGIDQSAHQRLIVPSSACKLYDVVSYFWSSLQKYKCKAPEQKLYSLVFMYILFENRICRRMHKSQTFPSCTVSNDFETLYVIQTLYVLWDCHH